MATRPGPNDDESLESLTDALERAMREPEADRDEALQRRLDELEARLEAKQRELEEREKPRLPEFETEFADRLEAIERKAEVARRERETQVQIQQASRPSDRESARGLALGLRAASMILGLPLAFYGIGWLIDQVTGATQFAPLGMLLGSALGVFGMIVTINRSGHGG